MPTTRMQVQAIAEKLVGMAPRFKNSNFTEPWLSCWKAIDEAAKGEEQQALIKALEGIADRAHIIEAILSAKPGGRLHDFKCLDELAKELPPIEWVWRGWMPRGMITLLGAAPGTGKSYLALELARRLIDGKHLPDGQPSVKGEGANVIYVDAEAVPQILAERAKAWEMNMKRLWMLLPEGEGMLDFGQQRDRDRLSEMTFEIAPELIIIDSLSSISLKGENNVEDVREILSFLSRLAQEYQAGLLLIHHLKKRSGSQVELWDLSMDDLRGSSHIAAIARVIMGLSVVQTAAEKDRNGPRKLEVLKTNLGAYPDPLGFEMLPQHPTGVLFRWGDAPEAYEEPTKEDECKEWMTDLLQSAPEGMKPKEIVERGKEEGFSRAMVYRARKELMAKIESKGGRNNPDSLWVLKE